MRILIIGGGPGGYVAAIRAAQLGAEVALAEKGPLGGTCLNVGCIPTKVLLHATSLLEEIRHASVYGINVTGESLDWDRLQKQKNKIVRQLTGGVAGLLKQNGVTVHKGTASFVDANTARVDAPDGGSTLVPFDKAVIATGSETVALPLPGMDLPCVAGSTEALSFSSPPASLIIVGGGVIGVELATVYARLGSKVTVLEAMEGILPGMDGEMAGLVAARLTASGVQLRTGCRVLAVREGGAVQFTDRDGKEQSATGDKVLVSVGRRPVTAGLGLEGLGLGMDRAAVRTDGYLRSTLPHIYAIGDCTGGIMLAHVASAQGLIAAENAVAGDKLTYDAKTVPSCVYTEPELASVGLTEEKARGKYANVRVGKFDLASNGKAMIMGVGGLVKLVCDGDTGEVLGLHILGPRATDMIAEGALALRLEATAEELVTTIHPHPTVVESLAEAANDVLGLCIHKH